uniref:Uncharacterized protein n=1 Tax=Trieres chinensis TaxID=1514140 RepID=A0A7S2EWN0_TRICV
MKESRTFPMYWGLPNAQDIRRGWEELRKDPLRPIRAARGVLVTEWRYRTADIRRLGFKRWLCGLRCGGRGEDAKSGMSDGREGQTGNDRGDTTNPDDESVATNERDCEEGPKCTRDRTLDLMPTTSTRSMFSSEGVGEG